MELAHARSLLCDTQVTVAPFAPIEDGKGLERLSRWARRFTPVVAPDPPDGLLLNIHGCAHLYGGEEQLADKVAGALARLGLRARIAVAPTYAGARAMARHGARTIAFIPQAGMRQALVALPVAALCPDRATRETLVEMGIETIGQLLDLPRKALAARFDDNLLRTIDQALGDVPELVEPVTEPRTFETAQAFDGPVTDRGIIESVSRSLLSDLVRELNTLQKGMRAMAIELRRILLEPVRVVLRLTSPSNNPAHLWSLLRPKLERANLGHGVEEVLLRAVQIGPVRQEQLTLWCDVLASGPAAQSTDFAELLDQLVHRLGARAVTQIQAVQSYVPERAFGHVSPSATPARTTERVRFTPRPSCVMAAPERVRVMALVPDGPPVRIQRRHHEHDIVAGTSPERIALPWWSDPQAQTRDYFMVQDTHGRWLWLFRDGASAEWFLHGEWV